MSTSPAAAPLTYAFHPRLGGAGVRLTLDGETLSYVVGAREGRLRLADIARLHLRFQPAKFASATFEMDVIGAEGTRLRVASASRTGLTNVRDQGPDYAAFVRALHGALTTAGTRVECRGGYGALRWGLMVALGAVAGAGLVAVVAFALLERQWTTAALIALLALLVGWPMVETLRRNRPLVYRLDELPQRLLPE